MLIDSVKTFCKDAYLTADTTHQCFECQHPDKCSGSCESCLEQVHYPTKYPYGLRDYNCPNILNYYTCKYSCKYASEIKHLLSKSETFNAIDSYHIMSIGCGASPDLMAVESYLSDANSSKKVSYIGYDINELWEPIHNRIMQYTLGSEHLKSKYRYVDAVDYFETNIVRKTNVLILQYIISHFYNTNQITSIEDFFQNLVNNIVMHKEAHNPMVVIINDVNSSKKGRNYFSKLVDILQEHDLHGSYSQWYFDYNIQHEGQRYGIRHESNCVLFPDEEDYQQFNPWNKCSSAQLLIEVR